MGTSLHNKSKKWLTWVFLQIQERRTQLFSATMTTKVAKLQRACLMDPVKVEVAQKYSTVDTLRQQYLFVPAKYKVWTCPICATRIQPVSTPSKHILSVRRNAEHQLAVWLS